MFWRVRRDQNFLIAITHHLPFSHYDFLKIGHFWTDVSLKDIAYELDINSGLPIPNIFPSSLHPVLLMDDKSFSLLGRFFSRSDFFVYDGKIESEHLNIVACKTAISGFDYDRSEYQRYDLAPPKDRIKKINKLRLRPNFATSYDLFRLSDEWALEFELIASDAFKSEYEAGRLTGLRFVAAC